jgi:BspA type Leucine rich repeat region (6 copies)
MSTPTTFYYSNNTSSTSNDATLSNSSYSIPDNYDLISVNVGTSCTALGNSCFGGCFNLTLVTIPNTVSSFGNNCFDSCTSLTSITIPNSVTLLGDGCFANCENLNTITIPNNVIQIGAECFNGCVGLTSIFLSINLTEIKAACFIGCQNLNSIIIPSNITRIGSNAFDYCIRLRTVIYNNQNNLTSVGSDIFFGITNPMTVTYYETANSSQLSTAAKSISYPTGSTFIYNPNPACFHENTKILCLINDNDKEILIKDITIGTYVKTYKHGYRKVKYIMKGSFTNNPNDDLSCMFQYNDLIVTGGHSIMVDELTNEEIEKHKKYDFNQTIDDKVLVLACCCNKFTKLKNTDTYNYYHIVLEPIISNDDRFGIYANGILSETPTVNFYLSKCV